MDGVKSVEKAKALLMECILLVINEKWKDSNVFRNYNKNVNDVLFEFAFDCNLRDMCVYWPLSNNVA